MTGLFVYDGPISKIKDKYYGVALNNKMFERYAKLVDELKVAILVKEKKEKTEKFSPIDLPFIKKIIPLPNRNIRNIKKAKQILKKAVEEVDLVVIRLPSLYGNYAAKIAREINKPYIIELVGSPWGTLWSHSWKGKVVAPYMWYITRKNVKRAKNVMYVTKCYLQKYYPNKFQAIGLSDVQLEKDEKNILEVRMQKKCEDKNVPIKIGTVGAINVKYKGQQDVIKAIARLKKQGFHILYELVGDGSTERLKKIAKQNKVEDSVSFLGPIPHGQVFEWLDSIDIYIQPSYQEGLSRALIEALSRACPCIASNAGGNIELIDMQYIYKKGDFYQLERLIKKILKNMEEQKKRNYFKSKEFEKERNEQERENYYQQFMRENFESEKR